MILSLIGRSLPDALALLKKSGIEDIRILECLPPEDKRNPNSEMRILRAKMIGETACLTVSPFETGVVSRKESEF